MKDPNDWSISDLRSEARNLSYLLKNYLADKAFVSQEPDAKLLYFIDSHELRSYITPNDPEHLRGFMLLAERARASRLNTQNADGLELEIRLKSEQLLHELLFDREGRTVLLPSHAEEIDEEIAYQKSQWIRERIALLDRARDQVRRLFALLPPNAKELNAAERDPSRKRRLVDFFRQAAPALMAILHRNPVSPVSRIEALINDSNLTPLSGCAWEEFGYDHTACERLRTLRPSHERVESWRTYLSDLREHSYRSNRIDAEALAYLQELNAHLAERAPGAPRVRAVLVTRAMTLIGAARKHGGADFLRHPRLLLLQSAARSRNESDSDKPPPFDGQSEQALIVSLRTYHQQLKTQSGEVNPGGDAEFNEAVDTLFNAWAEFERGRLTIELKSQPNTNLSITENVTVDAEFHALFEWLRRDADVERLVNEELLKAIQQFGQATFALGHSAERIFARVNSLSNPLRSQVIPMVSGAPLPIEFLAESLRRVEADHLDITDLLSDLQGSPAERYLAWSMLLACQRRWRLAEIYANSALDITKSKVVAPREAAWSRHEAQLLRAQISRLGSGEKNEIKQVRDALARYESSEKTLARATRPDARIPLERAAQLLEYRLLTADQQSGPSLKVGFELLCGALDLSKHNMPMQVRILALGVAYHVAALARGELWPNQEPSDKALLSEWHKQLHCMLSEQRKHVERDEISVRARALEILGFQHLSVEAPPSDQPAQPRPERLRIPSELRLDVFEVREKLKLSKDAIAGLISEDLEVLARRLDRYRRRDLIYAPVWAPYEYERIVDLIQDAEIRTLVHSAYRRLRDIAGPSEQLGVQPHNRPALSRVADDFEDCRRKLADQSGDMRTRTALFHLSMESCYSRLLLSSIAWERQRKLDLEALAGRYRQIASEFPEAAIPHFRLDTVLSNLGERGEEAAAEAQQALALIDADPFLSTRQHWVRSTIKRRVAARYMEQAEELREQLESGGSNEQLRRKYLDLLLQSFRIVYSGYPDEVASSHDNFFELEARRRVNNIAYYASLILEQPGGPARMDAMNFGQEDLRALVEKLSPSGIQEVTDVNIAHTIGYAHDVLSDIAQADLAANQLMILIRDTGGDPKRDKSVASAMADALKWFSRGADAAASGGTTLASYRI